MKYFNKLLFLTFLFAGSFSGVHAQEVSDFSTLTPEEYKQITLPSLDVLFENAKSAPIYKSAQVAEEIERKLLAKEKRAFLGFFSIRGSYQYGMLGTDYTFTDVYTPPTNRYSTSAQNSYAVGGAINIPLDNLFDLRSRIKRQKLMVKSAELEKEIKFEEQKREIIQMYSMALAQLGILKLRAEGLELASLQYEIAEKDFSFGAIDSSTLSVEKSRHSTAKEAYETSKFELTKSLMILEVITRTSILKR